MKYKGSLHFYKRYILTKPMPRAKKLTDFEKGFIIEKHNSGKFISLISKEIGRSRCVIINYLKNTSTYGTKKHSGRKKKLSPRVERGIINLEGIKILVEEKFYRIYH